MDMKFCVAFSVLLGCALAANYTIDDCPAGVPRNNHLRVFGSSCYTFHVSAEREFDAAEKACELHPPGHLVIIKDAATQQFLYDTLIHDFHYGGVVWIGLSDAENEGHFVWVDGTKATYTNWASGQPGIMGGIEDCVAMNVGKGGYWHDYVCHEVFFVSGDHRFVCEYPINGTPITTPSVSSEAVSSTTAATNTGATAAPPDATAQASDNPATAASGDCPPFQCSKNCGLAGFKVDDNQCMVCECETA